MIWISYLLAMFISNFGTAVVFIRINSRAYAKDLASRTEFGNKRYDEGIKAGREGLK